MDKSTLCCSFCNKSEHEVRALIAGPQVFICDACVACCNRILWRNFGPLRRLRALFRRPETWNRHSAVTAGPVG